VLEEILPHRLTGSLSDAPDREYDRLADWFVEHVNHDVFASEYLRR
jgi:hypothetical protein